MPQEVKTSEDSNKNSHKKFSGSRRYSDIDGTMSREKDVFCHTRKQERRRHFRKWYWIGLCLSIFILKLLFTHA